MNPNQFTTQQLQAMLAARGQGAQTPYTPTQPQFAQSTPAGPNPGSRLSAPNYGADTGYLNLAQSNSFEGHSRPQRYSPYGGRPSRGRGRGRGSFRGYPAAPAQQAAQGGAMRTSNRGRRGHSAAPEQAAHQARPRAQSHSAAQSGSRPNDNIHWRSLGKYNIIR